MPASPTPRNANEKEKSRLFLRTRTTFTKGPKALVSWLGSVRQRSAGGDESAGGERRSRVCRFGRVQRTCCPDLGGETLQLLLTVACLICYRTMSRCTCENPCADCKRRVNYICISRRWPANPSIHTYRNQVLVDVFTSINPRRAAATVSVCVAFVLRGLQWQKCDRS